MHRIQARKTNREKTNRSRGRSESRHAHRSLLNRSRTRSTPSPGLSSDEFRVEAKKMTKYIANYMKNVKKYRVAPDVQPGYLRDLLPSNPPLAPEKFDKVLEDFDKFIIPGITHWQHPQFHAFFSAGNSAPSILADMLSAALGTIGFTWAACPAMTELELVVLDWLGQMLGLPKEFSPFSEKGGGVIQGSASECNLVTMLTARHVALKKLREENPGVEDGILLTTLVAYTSKESHSSVRKAAMISMVNMRYLETDIKYRLRGSVLAKAINEDKKQGLIPFFVSTTLGTTSVCSFDDLNEIGPICKSNGIWLHVDAAYAGCSMICPEFRPLMSGIQYATSFVTNPNKWLLVNFDCSTMWVKDRYKLQDALYVDPVYLQSDWMGVEIVDRSKIVDYRHWSIPLSRRFRALKLWFVIRMYGVDGLQQYIRRHINLAKHFESLIRGDLDFEIFGEVHMGLVCFRLRGSDEINKQLLHDINATGQIYMVPALLSDVFVIRFCVCTEKATIEDIDFAYNLIKEKAAPIISKCTYFLFYFIDEKKIAPLKLNSNVLRWRKNTVPRLMITNETSRDRYAIKVRCSNNELYTVKPAYSFIEPNQTIEIVVQRQAEISKVDKIIIEANKAKIEDLSPKLLFESLDPDIKFVVQLISYGKE